MSPAKLFRLSVSAGVLGYAAAQISVPAASAHSTGHESRIVKHCERLPTPERQSCISCVTRPLKHHYHSDYPPGARCRPDNGKP
jgi:hypothetical protein